MNATPTTDPKATKHKPLPMPTLEQIENADRLAICRYFRFAPSSKTIEERACMEAIIKRFFALGGFTPELSNEIGWKVPKAWP